jgi:hypothetical protein
LLVVIRYTYPPHSKTHERVAEHVLPMLQEMKIPHKIVYLLSSYATMNAGDQKGKFITIYVRPLMYSFLALVKRLDRLLVEMQSYTGTTSNESDKRTSPARTANWPEWSPDLRFCF